MGYLEGLGTAHIHDNSAWRDPELGLTAHMGQSLACCSYLASVPVQLSRVAHPCQHHCCTLIPEGALSVSKKH